MLQDIDVHDVVRIFHFGVAPSLSAYKQRCRHAGRDGSPALVVLLVQPSVDRVKNKKRLARYTRARQRYEEDPDVDADEVAENSDSDSDTCATETTSDEDTDEGTDRDEDEEDPDELQAMRGEHGACQYRKKIEGGMRDWVEALQCRRAVEREYFSDPSPEICERSSAYSHPLMLNML